MARGKIRRKQENQTQLEDIGKVLLEKREDEHGISQAEMGRRIGVSQTTISRVEIGEEIPNEDLFERYVINYGLEIDDECRWHYLCYGRPSPKTTIIPIKEYIENSLKEVLRIKEKNRQEAIKQVEMLQYLFINIKASFGSIPSTSNLTPLFDEMKQNLENIRRDLRRKS